MRKTNEEVKFLTKKQVKRLFDTIEGSKNENKYWLRDLTIFNLSYYCGLRISEISLIKLENYNKETGEIYIKRLKGSNNTTIVLDKQRTYILNKYIREYKIKNDEDLLFKTKS
jgi:site-specific recombinase XerD